MIEGKQQFFMSHGQVSLGTVYKCDKCGQFASVNSVTICKGPNYAKAKAAAEKNGTVDVELFYNEKIDGHLCEKCDE
jgi:ribosomal protein L32